MVVHVLFCGHFGFAFIGRGFLLWHIESCDYGKCDYGAISSGGWLLVLWRVLECPRASSGTTRRGLAETYDREV